MKNDGKGICEHIKSNEKCTLSPLTVDVLRSWLDSIFANAKPSKRMVICSDEYLPIAYNELGRDKFFRFISQANLIVSQQGMDYLYSLGYPELKYDFKTGLNQIDGNTISITHLL